MKTRAQSEVIGVVLLTGVVVISATTIGFFILESQQKRIASEKPDVDFSSALNESNVEISHRGGESLPFSNLVLVVQDNDNERSYNLGDPADRNLTDSDGDDNFEFAERVVVDHSFTGEVRITLVDNSNPGHVLYDETKTVESTGPNKEPTIETFEITDNSDDLDASFDVAWNASDEQGDISEVTVEMINDGVVEDSVTTSFNEVGITGEYIDNLENKSGSGLSYKIKVTVTDAAGNTATSSTVANADSNIGLRYPTIVTFDVVDKSGGNGNGNGNNKDAIYDVTHNATDPDGDIVELVVTLIEESSGSEVENVTYAFNQTGVTGETTDTLSDTTGNNIDDTYRINISVKDAEGNVVKDTVTDKADGSGGGGGTGSAPTIDTFDVSDISTCSTAEYDISWAVSDSDSDLKTVTVEMINTQNNKIRDSATQSVSGGSASGTETLTKNGGCGKEYELKITVEDTRGNINTESWTDTADGSGSN